MKSNSVSNDPRFLSLEVLDHILKYNVTIDIAFEKKYSALNLSSRDIGLANAIIYGVLRKRGPLDWIISSASTTSLSKIDPSILNILRIGLFQIMYLDRIPVSAAVNTSVELAKKRTWKPFLAKFVNAVLRKCSTIHGNTSFPESRTSLSDYFYYRHSIPAWLSERWCKRFGMDGASRLADFINTIPPLSVRVNTLKTSRGELINSLNDDEGEVSSHIYSDAGFNIQGVRKNIAEVPGFSAGCFQIQDEAAQLVSILLDPKPGEKVLDACCGLGGKTGHIAQIMENRGSVHASDNDERKLDVLMSEMNRLGVKNVTTVQIDFLNPVPQDFHGTFDRILVDAPCSGLGVIRRNPDTKWTESKKDLKRYSERQLGILKNAASALKPGGRLVYSVCSFEPEENENVVDMFLKSMPDFVIDDNVHEMFQKPPLVFKGSDDRQVNGLVRIIPHETGMDGFFAACFKKI